MNIVFYSEIIGAIILSLVAVIFRILKNKIDKNEGEIRELKDTLFREYSSKHDVNRLKDDVNKLMDRILIQLDRIENKLDNKKDK